MPIPLETRIRLVALAHLVVGLWVVATVLFLRLAPALPLRLRAGEGGDQSRWILALNVIQAAWGAGLALVGVGLLVRATSVRPWAICLSAVSVYHFFAHGGWVAALKWWRVVGQGSNVALAVSTVTALATVALGAFSLWFFTRRAVRQALPISTRPSRWLIPVLAGALVLAWEYSRTELQSATLSAFARARQPPPGARPSSQCRSLNTRGRRRWGRFRG